MTLQTWQQCVACVCVCVCIWLGFVTESERRQHTQIYSYTDGYTDAIDLNA